MKSLHQVYITEVPTTEIDSCSKQRHFAERHNSDGDIGHIRQTKSDLVAYRNISKSAAKTANSLKTSPDINDSFLEEKSLHVR